MIRLVPFNGCNGRIALSREPPRVRWHIAAVAALSLALAPVCIQSLRAEKLAYGGVDYSGRLATGLLRIQDAQPSAVPDDHARKIEAAKTFLKHIYAVYLGLRACTELSNERKDQSFQPSVSLEEARRVLKSIDAATAEVGVHSDEIWASIAPQATVTAESLKADPAKHAEFCQRMGGIFRVDASNLQSVLAGLGAKTPLILKDY